MLQQTRVEAVRPFYAAFLSRFPDVRALAAASEEEVLRHWAGLGYYRRARMLHRAASQVCEQRGGEFPRTPEEWRELPGVGEYTAAAVSSIAFGVPAPVVDGNVKRVAARFLGLELAPSARELHRRAAEWGADLLAATAEAGPLNESLMELGATLCTARAPRCGSCPLAVDCRAHAQGTEEALPLPAARPKWKEVRRVVLLGERGGRFLLRRLERGWTPGLYEPPLLREGSFAQLCRRWGSEGLGGSLGAELGRFRHVITRHKLLLRVIELRDPPVADLVDPAAVPLSGIARKALRWAGKDSR